MVYGKRCTKKTVKIENWNNGLLVGKYKVYNTSNKLIYSTDFGKNGNGKFKDYYYKLGVLKEEGDYQDGKKQGEWCFYDEKGKLLKSLNYEKGVPIN